jgi:hypothetical protein
LVESAIHSGELTATVAPWLTTTLGRPPLGFSAVVGAVWGAGALVAGGGVGAEEEEEELHA